MYLGMYHSYPFISVRLRFHAVEGGREGDVSQEGYPLKPFNDLTF